MQSYRGFKAEWVGRPLSTPSLVVEREGKEGACAVGYVSWNGATGVQRWVVFAGPVGAELERVGSVRSRGFETRFTVKGDCVRVGAVVRGEGEEEEEEEKEEEGGKVDGPSAWSEIVCV